MHRTLIYFYSSVIYKKEKKLRKSSDASTITSLMMGVKLLKYSPCKHYLKLTKYSLGRLFCILSSRVSNSVLRAFSEPVCVSIQSIFHIGTHLDVPNQIDKFLPRVYSPYF